MERYRMYGILNEHALYFMNELSTWIQSFMSLFCYKELRYDLY